MNKTRISQAEAARITGLSVRSVSRLADRGILDRRTRSGRVTYSAERVEAVRVSLAERSSSQRPTSIAFSRGELESLAAAGALDVNGAITGRSIAATLTRWRSRVRELRRYVDQLGPTHAPQELDQGLLEHGG